MAGKYAAASRRFPKADPRDQAFQERVDAAKKDARGADHARILRAEFDKLAGSVAAFERVERPRRRETASDIAHLYSDLRDLKDALDVFASDLNVRVAAAEQRMWDGFEAQKLEKVGLDGGGSVSVTQDVTIQVTDAAALNAWARENGLESKLTLYHSTVESIMRERILAGDAVPAFIKVGSINKTTYRR